MARKTKAGIRLRSELRSVYNQAQRAVEDLADQYRRDVLIPLCRRHKLTFLSGNGTWFFCRGETQIGDDLDARQHRLAVLIPVLAMLNETVLSRHDHFGFYMSDVKEADL